MRKLMAICLAMLMALSMCSFSVMAEGGVDFAEIANGQPANFVTADLDLGGYTITSSDENVIALDGTVTRPLFEDKAVQITIDGGDAIDVTVKAKTVEPLYAEDFAIDNEAVLEGEYYRFADYSEWSLGKSNGAVSIADGRLVANHTDGEGRVWLYAKTPVPVTDEPVTIQFDSTEIADVAVGIDIRLAGYLYNAEGAIIGNLNSGGAVARLNSSGWGSYWMGGYKKAGVTIKYDPMTGEFWGNGVLAAKNLITDNATISEGYTTDDVAKVAITSLTFVDAADSATGTYSIDNFAVYQDVPEADVLANATAEEKAAYYASFLDEEFVANGGSFAALVTDLNFAADAELPAGVEITWESSDEAVIATDGTLTRPFFEAKEITINGALVIDGEEYATAEYVVSVLPLSIGSATEIADAENLPVGSFVGADGWTPATINTWEAMEVKEDTDDNNKYFSMSTSAYQPSGSSPKYTFASNPVIGEGDTLVFEAKVRIPVKGGVANWGLILNGTEMAEFIYYNGYLYDNDYDLGNDAYYGPGAARTDKLVTVGQWYDIRFEITEDAAAAKGWTVKCYIEDKLVGTHSTKAAVPAEITSTAFLFTGRLNMDSATEPTTPVYFFDTDDIQVYTSKDVSSVINDLDDAGKVNFFKELISSTEFTGVTAGQNLGLTASYADYDLASLGVNITWGTSDDAYIGKDGVVKTLAPIGTTKTVTLTATIEAGLEEATATVEVELNDGTELVKSVDFSDTTTALGATQFVTDDAAHGSVIYMKQDAAAHKGSGTIANISGGGRGDRLVLEADVKYVHGDNESCYGAFRVLTYAGKPGIQVGLNYNTGNISLITTTAQSNGAATGLNVNTSKSVQYPMPESVLAKGEGEWVHITVDHNALSQTYQVYVDGHLINEVPILQASMDLGSNGGSAIRGYSLELSLEGEMWVDNVSLKKYSNTNAVEVNAALNAALVEYASEEYRSVLTNREFAPMTIGKSWINGSAYKRDLNGTGEGETPSIKVENPSTYAFVTDGPQLTYAINGETVTALNVDKAAIVDLTITAEANGITESLTVKRKVAPVAIRGLGLGTASCLNGLWLEGATGTEKVIVVQCLENGKPAYSYTPATDEEPAYEWFGVQVFDLAELTNSEDYKSYDPATGLLKGTSVPHPGESDTITEVRIFVIGNGIAPVTFRSGLLDW